MKIYYITKGGKHTDDPSKAIYGAVENPRDLKAPRFVPHHDGHEMIWEEREIGLPVREEPKKSKKK